MKLPWSFYEIVKKKGQILNILVFKEGFIDLFTFLHLWLTTIDTL